MDYELRITDEQARVLRDACEMYARVGMGQLEFIAEHPALSGTASCVRPYIRAAENALHTVTLLNEEAPRVRRSWDLYQVIRGRLAWDDAGNPPARPTMQVMYDKPLSTAGEPLAEIRADDTATLLLSSLDGQGYSRAVQYPKDWSDAKADQLAIEAFDAAQKPDPIDWNWDDVARELKARGLTIPAWRAGPAWDKQRLPFPPETTE